MLKEQAVLWAGLHQILIEDPGEGVSSLKDVERRLVVALLSKAAVAKATQGPLQIEWDEAKSMEVDALSVITDDAAVLLTALWLVLEDETLRSDYEILLRALAFVALELQRTQPDVWQDALFAVQWTMSSSQGGNLRRLLELEGRLDEETEQMLRRLLGEEDEA